ncbi:MAG: signal recognition particle-docking protein FtsY [Flavobacteriaceae bacterium]|nr:signal recognition particle-docking protein FtsY [Flavobacteriaceae bacterium]MDP4674314.1 signal recognition particle-docking protein FtsY [Flavobacteriaceae bacterium]MDP4754233.1 signal recognition particle-docking protein FtsY [Flavobacteriaceae bacterium]MDP4885163.1 signal recognition particle-docking protein FtsY [Flavobacteriaceae bacterium]MDP5113429.1 signal recognition particle-docking protein FtsY [Flavobacteriaceae bacterium]
MSFFKKIFSSPDKEKLDQGLEPSKQSFIAKLEKAVMGKDQVDDDVLDELEEVLIASDVGVATTLKVVDRVQQRVKKDKYVGVDQLHGILKQEIASLFLEQDKSPEYLWEQKPHVIMVVGVNGAGKTTTIGKLAHQFKAKGLNVLLGAADTFRAAAIDQLQVWADRAQVPMVRQQMGSDPASVAFEAITEGVQRGADVVIVDTAGRLHNKVNLMNELAKIKRVMERVVPGAPHEVLLVLDGSTGQNAFEQAKQFTLATEVTALAITKLDGTAKGGVVLGISDQFQIPVRYIGVGEGIEDLQAFDRVAFVQSFFNLKKEA